MTVTNRPKLVARPTGARKIGVGLTGFNACIDATDLYFAILKVLGDLGNTIALTLFER